MPIVALKYASMQQKGEIPVFHFPLVCKEICLDWDFHTYPLILANRRMGVMLTGTFCMLIMP